MKRPSYSWLLKWILAAILIGVGLVFFFEESLVYLITGSVIVIFSIFRVWPLLKSLDKEILRTINLVEIVLSTLVGVALIIIGVKAINNDLDPNGPWGLVYRYSLVYVLAARAVVFLYSVVFLGEKTEQVKFWTHLLLLPVGTVIAVSEKFDASLIGWLLLIISLIGGAYLIYDGSKGYGGYRKYQLEMNKTKTKDKTKKPEINDSVIIEKDDDDRPYVN